MDDAATPAPGEQNDLWSPTWANTWVRDTVWAPDNIGRWALLARRTITSHEDLVGLADTFTELRTQHPTYFQDRYRKLVRLVHLTVDDDPNKVYVYLSEPTPVVYYALSECDGIIKIGTSKWVGHRMLQLPDDMHGPWKLLAIEPGGKEIEAERHAQFDEYWIAPTRKTESRELFAPGPPVIDHVRALLDGPHQWLQREDIDKRALRLVLDRHVPAPAYRPRLDVRVSQAVSEHLLNVAAERGVTPDELVEKALASHLPQARTDRHEVARKAEADRLARLAEIHAEGERWRAAHPAPPPWGDRRVRVVEGPTPVT